MNCPIIDLHSDLLSYLCMGSHRTPNDPNSRCSLTQLKEGHVTLQTLAIFSQTKPGSTAVASKQIQAFRKLNSTNLDSVRFIPAFENAAGFAEEDEPLERSFQRLEQITADLGPILYIGITWDGENRFGGGVGSNRGLKEDGKRLLEWMQGKGIAIDFSHTSDPLAEGILNHIDQENLTLPVLASHSNFRAITSRARNVPDWLATELIRRQGLLGMNLFAPFIHNTDPTALIRHVEYAFSLGAHDALAFGADFFCDTDFPDIKAKYQTDTAFFDLFGNASCYGSILNLLRTKLHLSEEQLRKIGSGNAERFLQKLEVPLKF